MVNELETSFGDHADWGLSTGQGFLNFSVLHGETNNSDGDWSTRLTMEDRAGIFRAEAMVPCALGPGSGFGNCEFATGVGPVIEGKSNRYG
jgi:hypothetical protein